MKGEFKVFTRESVRGSEPRIGLHTRGAFSLNRHAFDLLGWPGHIVYLFNDQERLAGLQPAEADDPNAYAVRKHPNASSWIIAARAFCNAHGIAFGGRVRHFSPRLEEGNLVFSVGKEGQQ